jgi:hypothetical protein
LVQDILSAFNGSVNGSDITAVTNLTTRTNKSIRIIIEDVPIYGNGKDYEVTNGRTCRIRYEYVSTAANPSSIYNTVVDALKEASTAPL